MGYDLHEKAAALVRDAGGKLVGRTRLQKVAYLTQLAGFARDFPFEYRHYGPYSEELAEAMEIASGSTLWRRTRGCPPPVRRTLSTVPACRCR